MSFTGKVVLVAGAFVVGTAVGYMTGKVVLTKLKKVHATIKRTTQRLEDMLSELEKEAARASQECKDTAAEIDQLVVELQSRDAQCVN